MQSFVRSRRPMLPVFDTFIALRWAMRHRAGDPESGTHGGRTSRTSRKVMHNSLAAFELANKSK